MHIAIIICFPCIFELRIEKIIFDLFFEVFMKQTVKSKNSWNM